MKDIVLNKESRFKLKKRKSSIGSMILQATMIILVILMLGPILITVFAAFKTSAQIAVDFPIKPPMSFYFENFKYAFFNGNILLGLKNSSILVFSSLVSNIIIGTMSAFVFSRFEFKGKKVVMGLFMIGMVVPSVITEISRFIVIKNIGAYNTIFAPIIIYSATDMMQLYIYLQFLDKIPISLDESVLVDGGSYWTIYSRIIFPLLLPATVTLGIIKSIFVLNDMYIPYLYMPSNSLRTLTTTLMDFSGSLGGQIEYLSAAIILVALPTIIIYLIFQRFIFAGIVSGAVKE